MQARSGWVNRLQALRWLGVVAGLLIAGVCVGCSSQQSATMAARPIDYSATSVYLQAREQFVLASIASLPAGRSPMTAFVAQVHSDCAGILRNVPVHYESFVANNMSATEQQVALEEAGLILELEGSVETAQRQAQAMAVERFAALVASLSWSDQRINTLVHAFIEVEMQRRRMVPFAVCKKLGEWASTGYKKVPAPTPIEPSGALGRRWAHALAALGCIKSPAAPSDVSAALRPYQRADAHPNTESVESLERRLAVEELRASLDAKRSLFHAIGLSSVAIRRPSHRHRRRSSEKSSGALPACIGEPDRSSK